MGRYSETALLQQGQTNLEMCVRQAGTDEVVLTRANDGTIKRLHAEESSRGKQTKQTRDDLTWGSRLGVSSRRGRGYIGHAIKQRRTAHETETGRIGAPARRPETRSQQEEQQEQQFPRVFAGHVGPGAQAQARREGWPFPMDGMGAAPWLSGRQSRAWE